jgi:hypothetical protein
MNFKKKAKNIRLGDLNWVSEPRHVKSEFALNLCTRRPPTGVMIPDAV